MTDIFTLAPLSTKAPLEPIPATVTDLGNGTLRATSPVIVTAQMIPKGCRKPRPVVLHTTITCELTAIDTTIPVAEWQDESSRFNTNHLLEYDTATERFYRNLEAHVPPGTNEVAKMLEAAPEGHTVEPLATYVRDSAYVGFLRIEISLPARLNNGAPNPLAVFGSEHFNAVTHCENVPTGPYPFVYTTSGNYSSSGRVFYMNDLGDIHRIVGNVLRPRIMQRIIINNRLFVETREPTVVLDNRYSTGEAHCGISFDPGDGEDESKIPPIAISDPQLQRNLATNGVSLTLHEGAEHLRHGLLTDAIDTLQGEIGIKQADIIQEVVNPTGDGTSHEDVWSSYTWCDKQERNINKLASIASTLKQLKTLAV